MGVVRRVSIFRGMPVILQTLQPAVQLVHRSRQEDQCLDLDLTGRFDLLAELFHFCPHRVYHRARVLDKPRSRRRPANKPGYGSEAGHAQTLQVGASQRILPSALVALC